MTAEFATADLYDDHTDEVEVGEPIFRHYGGRRRFFGPAVTLSTFEDNSMVRPILARPGEGRVLIVDGGGSVRYALLGDQLGSLAVENGWSGVIVHGAVRDTAVLATMDLGVLALATCPARSRKEGQGQENHMVRIAGLTIKPGDWIYADADGLLKADRDLTASGS
jgi:regulator of ribonuclease activity A